MRFDTIYYPTQNVHLKKDVGQVPFMFHKLFGCESSLVTYFNPSDHDNFSKDVELHYPYLCHEVKGLKLRFLGNRERGKFYEKPVVRYIIENATKIDVLHLFHFSVETVLYGLLYKLLNPKGILYVKLDIDINYFKSRAHFINVNSSFSYLKIKFFDRVVLPVFKKAVNLFSAETEAGLIMFRDRFKVEDKKIAKVMNGVDREILTKCVSHLKDYTQKDNVIVCTGTLGLKQKNYSFLFNALTGVNLNDWKVYCIGKIEDSFTPEIDIFFSKNPEKRNSVILTGEILDNKVLYELYNSSKVVCQVSEWEGFSISTCEALFFGNYPILTETIGSMQELTNNNEFGRTVELNNETQLTSVIQELIDNPEVVKKDFDSIIKYSRKRLVWQEIVPELKNLLMK